jgi:hypothetical protein
MAKALDPISPLPQPPSRQDPANFASRGDAFLEALKVFSDELGIFIVGVNGILPELENAPGTAAYLAAQQAAASAVNAAQDAGRAAAAANEAAKRVSGISVLTVEPNAVAYVSPASFSVAADVRAIYQVDTAVSLVQAAAAGGWVTAADWDGSKTIVSVSCTVETSLSSVLVGPARSALPRVGTAALLDSGNSAEDVTTHAQVDAKISAKATEMYHPQAIIKAPMGMRPVGWGPQDCDAPVISIIAGDNLVHTSQWGPMGIVMASTEYTTSYPAWKILSASNAAETDAWLSSANTFSGGVVIDSVNGQWVEVEFHTPRSFDRIFMSTVYYAASWANVTPKDFQVIGDGKVLLDKVGYVPDALGSTGEFVLTTPAVNVKKLRVKVTRIQNGVAGYVAIGKLKIGFTDVATGHVAVTAGLQVAYADSGRVRLSDELATPLLVDVSATSDVKKLYVYVLPGADGSLVSAGVSDAAPQVGYERAAPKLPPSGVNVGSMSNLSRAFDEDITKTAGECCAAGYTVYGSVGNDFGSPVLLNHATLYASSDSGFNSGSGGNTLKIVASNANDATTAIEIASIYKATDAAGAIELINLSGNTTPYRYWWAVIIPDGATDSKYIAQIEWFVASAVDMYNPATLTMVDCSNIPIRRVYIGSIVVSYGTIVAVNCYALGKRVRVPANYGSSVVANTLYSVVNPFGYDGASIDARYKKNTEWVPHATIYYYGTTGYGRRYSKLDSNKYEWGYKEYIDSDAPGNVSNVPVTIIFERGY